MSHQLLCIRDALADVGAIAVLADFRVACKGGLRAIGKSRTSILPNYVTDTDTRTEIIIKDHLSLKGCRPCA
jgi:hypothetical protein